MTRTEQSPPSFLPFNLDLQIGPCPNQPHPNQPHNKKTREDKTVFGVYCLGSEDCNTREERLLTLPVGKERKWIPK